MCLKHEHITKRTNLLYIRQFTTTMNIQQKPFNMSTNNHRKSFISSILTLYLHALCHIKIKKKKRKKLEKALKY